MRYYPKLGIFKNSTESNKFDGKRATSYGWYTYAVKLSDGSFVMCRNSYSIQTGKHMSEFSRLVGYDNCRLTVYAPQGLGDLDAAKSFALRSIARLEQELLNKRNRNISGRKAEIETFKKDLETIEMLNNDESFTAIMGKRYSKVG